LTESTEIAERDEAALAVADETTAAIAAAQAEEYGDEPLQTPILKIGQGLTREVAEGEAEVGEFINTLTGDSLGTVVEFVVAYYNRGRFASEKKSGRAYVAFGSTIPQSWEPLVGAEFVGTPFAEYPEAEEQFKAAVNAKEREWGEGPLVSTTHNYTGLVLVEGEDGVVEPEPVRLSLKRIDVPAHRKLSTLLRAVLRNKPTWDKVVRLATTGRDFGRNTAYTIDPTGVRFVRDTTPEERAYAAEVAQAVLAGRTVSADAEAAVEDKPAEPKASGGLDVG
jgi:hypothetical protein